MINGKKILLILLFLFNASALFIPSDYFYENETPTVEYINTTVEGYKIVYFDGKPVFLINNGSIVLDENEIKYVLDKFYRDLYPLNESDVERALQFLYEFNRSRFDNDNPYKIEEQRCRDLLGERVAKSMTPKQLEKTINSPGFKGDIYKFYAALLVGNDLVPPGYDEKYVAEQLRYFFTNSDNLSYSLYEAVKALTSLDQSVGVVNKTREVISFIEDAERYAKNIERSRVLGINDREICGSEGCLYLCPVPNYNYSALYDAKEILMNIEDEMKSYEEWLEVYESILNETNARLFYSFSSSEKDRVLRALRPLEKDWNKTKVKVDELLKNVRDSILTQYYGEVEGYFEEIYGDIEKFELNNTYDKVLNLTDALKRLKERYNYVYSYYDKLNYYKHLTDVAVQYTNNETIKLEKNSLDKDFVFPIAMNSLISLSSSYESLFNKSRSEIVLTPSLLDSFATFIVKGFLSPISLFVKPYFSINFLKELKPVISVIYALIVVFSFVFIAMLFYSTHYSLFYRKKYFYGVVVGVISFVIFVGSAGAFYLSLERALNMDDVRVFLNELSYYDNVDVIYVEGTSFDDEIKACANSLSKELSLLGKNVTSYSISSLLSCVSDLSLENISECLSLNEPKAYIIMMAGDESINTYVFGEPTLLFYSTKEGFKECKVSHYISLLNSLKEVGRNE